MSVVFTIEKIPQLTHTKPLICPWNESVPRYAAVAAHGDGLEGAGEGAGFGGSIDQSHSTHSSGRPDRDVYHSKPKIPTNGNRLRSVFLYQKNMFYSSVVDFALSATCSLSPFLARCFLPYVYSNTLISHLPPRNRTLHLMRSDVLIKISIIFSAASFNLPLICMRFERS